MLSQVILREMAVKVMYEFCPPVEGGGKGSASKQPLIVNLLPAA